MNYRNNRRKRRVDSWRINLNFRGLNRGALAIVSIKQRSVSVNLESLGFKRWGSKSKRTSNLNQRKRIRAA